MPLTFRSSHRLFQTYLIYHYREAVPIMLLHNCDKMKKNPINNAYKIPPTVRVSEKTWQVIVQTSGP